MIKAINLFLLDFEPLKHYPSKFYYDITTGGHQKTNLGSNNDQSGVCRTVVLLKTRFPTYLPPLGLYMQKYPDYVRKIHFLTSFNQSFLDLTLHQKW